MRVSHAFIKSCVLVSLKNVYNLKNGFLENDLFARLLEPVFKGFRGELYQNIHEFLLTISSSVQGLSVHRYGPRRLPHPITASSTHRKT